MFLKESSFNLNLFLSYMLIIHCLLPSALPCSLLALEGPLRCCILIFVRSCKTFDYAFEKFIHSIRRMNYRGARNGPQKLERKFIPWHLRNNKVYG